MSELTERERAQLRIVRWLIVLSAVGIVVLAVLDVIRIARLLG